MIEVSFLCIVICLSMKLSRGSKILYIYIYHVYDVFIYGRNINIRIYACKCMWIDGYLCIKWYNTQEWNAW